jgi:hypothetical protein
MVQAVLLTSMMVQAVLLNSMMVQAVPLSSITRVSSLMRRLQLTSQPEQKMHTHEQNGGYER